MRRTLARTELCFPLSAGLLALVVCVAYNSVIVYHYAYADDFLTLYEVRTKSLVDKIAPFYNTQGRPLGGWIVAAAYRAAWTLDGLGKLRMASLGLTLICGWILAAEFRRVTPWWIGLGAVSMILLNPAASVFVAWVSSGLLSLPAATLALLGGSTWRRAFDGGEVRSPRFWLQIGGACLLALAALLIYQPCACYFLLPASIRLLDRNDARGALRAGAWCAGGFTLLCAGYFAAYQIVRPHLSKAEDIVIHRADVVRDVAGRLRFYLTDVVPRSFESWPVFFGAVPRGVALCVGVVFTSLLLVRVARTPGGAVVRWQSRLLVPALFVLASSPLLIVKDNYAPFRTLAVEYSLVAVGLAGGVVTLWRSLPARRRAARNATFAFWVGLTVVNALLTGYVTKEGFVLRSVRQLDLYRHYVRRRFPQPPGESIFLLPHSRDLPRLGKIDSRHEFGTSSSSVDWSFPGLLFFVLDEEYAAAHSGAGARSGEDLIVHDVPADGPTLFSADLPVIDAKDILDGSQADNARPCSGPVTHDDFFGDVQQLTPALRLSRWFGLYEVLAPTRIAHHELGALELAGSGGSDCWFYREGIGWFWTSPASFPFVYSGEHKHWLWYVRGTRNPPEFYDFDVPGKPLVPLP